LAILLGVPLGVTTGYYGGKYDEIAMRLTDALISFPALLLALLFVGIFGANLLNLVVAIGVVYAPRNARVIRSSVLSVKNHDFVKAAKARGESNIYIMRHEILPNIWAPIIIEGSIRIGFAIFIGTSLSFLGLGTQPPTPDLGYMVSTGRENLYNSRWMLIFPSLFLAMLIIGFNLLGDALRDILEFE